MVVIVILGILAALIVPKVISRPDEARIVAAKQDVATLAQALRLYKLDNLAYPTTDQGLQALVVKPARGADPGQLEDWRIPRAAAEGSVGTRLPLPESGAPRRDRHL
jgi:type II secretion system protein G